MSRTLWSWAPAAILASGVVLVQGISDQRRVPLREPLANAVPVSMVGYESQDLEISEEEQAVAGMSSYVMRVFGAATLPAFTLYVGYYESQTQGKTIHSPKNCLPGGGWEAIGAATATIATAGGAVEVNRYTIQNGSQRAVVLYWYQGRGRVAASEYQVKWDLLRDAALRGRSEEALVRVLVPVSGTEDEAFALASTIAREVVPAVYRALPQS